MLLVEARNITKAFGGLMALEGVDIAIGTQEIVGLIGPNGAGKSTCVNVLSGYYKATSGQTIFAGEDITKLNLYQTARRGLVRSFQHAFNFKEFTVLENTIIGQHLSGRPGIFHGLFMLPSYRRKEREVERKAEEMLEFAGLWHVRNERAGELPYGYQKLLGMAVAASANPKVLLLDEPVAGMNAGETDQAMDLVKRMRSERGMSILLIEHNVRAIMGVCDRIVVLNFGKKIADGTPQEVSQNKAVIDAYLGDEVYVA